MESKDIIKVAVYVFIGLTLAPVVVRGACIIVGMTVGGVSVGIKKVKFNKKMKRGIKEGRIIKIGEDYYEVEHTEKA